MIYNYINLSIHFLTLNIFNFHRNRKFDVMRYIFQNLQIDEESLYICLSYVRSTIKVNESCVPVLRYGSVHNDCHDRNRRYLIRLNPVSLTFPLYAWRAQKSTRHIHAAAWNNSTFLLSSATWNNRTRITFIL